jgi:hypothetical protein
MQKTQLKQDLALRICHNSVKIKNLENNVKDNSKDIYRKM